MILCGISFLGIPKQLCELEGGASPAEACHCLWDLRCYSLTPLPVHVLLINYRANGTNCLLPLLPCLLQHDGLYFFLNCEVFFPHAVSYQVFNH